MPESNVADLESRGLRFVVRLLVKHPSKNLAETGIRLGLEARQSQNKGGELRMGREIKSRIQPSWSYRIVIANKRKFSHSIGILAEKIHQQRESFLEIRQTGGSITLILELEGVRNIGDVIGADTLLMLAESGCDLGVEVFPTKQGR